LIPEDATRPIGEVLLDGAGWADAVLKLAADEVEHLRNIARVRPLPPPKKPSDLCPPCLDANEHSREFRARLVRQQSGTVSIRIESRVARVLGRATRHQPIVTCGPLLDILCAADSSLISRLVCLAMAEIVLRVRLLGGDHLDVTYEEADTVDPDAVTEHAIATLAQDGGALRVRHGDRLVVLYGRGVAALEVAPRGAVV
jgi:hypothetical protein